MKYSFGVRVGLILIALLVIGVSVFLIINREGGEEAYSNKNNVRATSIVAEANKDIRSDPDNDGLKNWEEILWGTDKFNADTDGDGTDDGIEVAQKRNPTQAGDDQLILSEPTENTVTKQLSIDLLSQYLITKDAGANIQGPVTNDIVGSVLTNDYLSLPVEKHEGTDLIITTSISLETYAQTMGNLFISASGKANAPSEIELFNQYQQTEDPALLEQLSDPLSRYTTLRNALLSTPTPPQTAVSHLTMLNALEQMRSGLVGMQKANNDAVLSIVGLSVYEKGLTNMTAALQLVEQIYNDANITFQQNTSGYVFLYGL